MPEGVNRAEAARRGLLDELHCRLIHQILYILRASAMG
jgi:hypothetical protein